MKTNTLTKLFYGISMLMALTLLMSSCGNGDSRKSFYDAVEYNDYVIGQLHHIDGFYNDGMTSVKDSVAAQKFCQDLEKETKLTLENMNIQPFDGDSTLAEATKELIKHLNAISTKELPEFFSIIYNKNRSQEDQPKIDEMSKKIDGEYSRIWTRIGIVQNVFASQNNLRLTNLTH